MPSCIALTALKLLSSSFGKTKPSQSQNQSSIIQTKRSLTFIPRDISETHVKLHSFHLGDVTFDYVFNGSILDQLPPIEPH
jgi:hypothetical protein